VNDSIYLGDPPFVLVGDVGFCKFKSFWYKFWCKLDEEIMLLCPPKNNLRTNLQNHLHGLVHTKCLEDVVAGERSTCKSTAASTRKRGRPTTRSRLNIGKQNDLHTWFTGASIANSRTTKESQLGVSSNSIIVGFFGKKRLSTMISCLGWTLC